MFVKMRSHRHGNWKEAYRHLGKACDAAMGGGGAQWYPTSPTQHAACLLQHLYSRYKNRTRMITTPITMPMMASSEIGCVTPISLAAPRTPLLTSSDIVYALCVHALIFGVSARQKQRVMALGNAAVA